MYVAVVSDLHGRVWEPLRWALAIAEETGCVVTAILCCGDLGFFGDLGRLDKATLKHLRSSVREAEFTLRFARKDREVEAWLDRLPAPLPPLYFVRGNHEDHEILAALDAGSRPVAVDVYGLVWYLPDAAPLVLHGTENERLTVLGLGGVANVNPRRSHPFAGIQTEAVEKLLYENEPGSIDVLLTHDGPRLRNFGHEELSGSEAADIPGAESYLDRYGDERVSWVVELLQPPYHFFGHFHRPMLPFRLGACHCIPVASTAGFSVSPSRYGGVLGLLEWRDKECHRFSWIHSPWLQKWRWSPEPRIIEAGEDGLVGGVAESPPPRQGGPRLDVV